MEVIDLWELFGVLLRRIWLIILVAALAGAAAFGYTYYFVEPLYKSSTLLYVNNSSISIGTTSVSISGSELNAAQKLVNTYLVILKSRSVLNDVIEAADLPYSYDRVKGMISAEAVNSTEIFQIVVTSTDPREAEHIANTIAEVLPDKIADIVAGSDVRIVDYAVVPAHRSSPSYTRNTSIGCLLGAALTIAILVLIYLLDEGIRSEDYLTKTYPDIPLLAVIPDMDPNHHSSGGYYYYRSHYGSGYGYGQGHRTQSEVQSRGTDQ